MGSQCCGARGAVGGSVPCSRVSPQSWYWRWRERWLFALPTDYSCRKFAQPCSQCNKRYLWEVGHLRVKKKEHKSCKHLTLQKQASMRKWSQLREYKQNLVWSNRLWSSQWGETDTQNNQPSITHTAWYCRTKDNNQNRQSKQPGNWEYFQWQLHKGQQVQEKTVCPTLHETLLFLHSIHPASSCCVSVL